VAQGRPGAGILRGFISTAQNDTKPGERAPLVTLSNRNVPAKGPGFGWVPPAHRRPLTLMAAYRGLHTRGLRVLELFQLFGHLGDGLEEVGDQAVVGDGENRRLFVLVDRDDDLGILHPGQMLDRA